MNDDRKTEVQMISGILRALCIKNDISLVPYKLKNGTYITAVHDHIDNKTYALIKEEESVTNE